MRMVLLQTPSFNVFSSPDPAANRIALLIFGALVIAIVAASIYSGRTRSTGRGGARGLGRRARQMGLARHHVRMLQEMTRELRIQNPVRLLSEGEFLTAAVRRMVKKIDASSLSSEEKENRKALVFQIKRTVAIAQTRSGSPTSTGTLRVGRAVKLSTDGETWYDSTVTSNTKGTFGIQVPYDGRGRDVLLDRGTAVHVSFSMEGDGKLCRLQTKVAGMTRSRTGSSLLLAHTDKVDQSQKRRYPRREIDRPAFFWPVDVLTVGVGKKAKKQAVVNKYRRGFGRIDDLSAGGCSLRSSSPLAVGVLLKIEFETEDKSRMAVFGKVQSIDRTPGRFGQMHVMFTKVSRSNLNRIQSFVYGVDSELS
jgi:hypothetical protein